MLSEKLSSSFSIDNETHAAVIDGVLLLDACSDSRPMAWV
jgi:hypothetical protein